MPVRENKSLQGLPASRRFRAIVVSHTHWDREWYLTQKQFQFLLGDTLDAVVDAVEHEPGFHCFMADGQTSVIQDYLEIRPHRRAQVERLIRGEGLIVGPWYTMPDFWLPSGEAIIRNLLRGRLDCERMGAQPQRIGYAPDSFGHIEQMPQILNGFGIENYFYSRGKPEQGEQDELAFWWCGPDERGRVLAYALPGGYFNALMLPTTDSQDVRERIEAILRPYRQGEDSLGTALLLNGVDHIWVQRDLPRAVALAGELIPAVDFEIGTLEQFHRAFVDASEARSLPSRSGCLRDTGLVSGHLHGTWSSRIDNKLENARASFILERLAEPAAAQSVISGGAPRRSELAMAWQAMLQNHAHDSICGCSMDAVHADVSQRFRHVEEIAEMVVADALRGVAGRADRPVLLRMTGLAGAYGCCEFIVDAAVETSPSVIGPDGNAYPIQTLSTRRLRRTDAVISDRKPFDSDTRPFEFTEHRVLALLPEALPLETQRFNLADTLQKTPPPDAVKVTAHGLENALIRVEVCEGGTLQLLHKPTGKMYNRLLELIDDADTGGGYMFKPLTGDHPERSGRMRVEVVATESGPIRGTLVIRGAWPLPTGINETGRARTIGRMSCDVQWQLSLVSGQEQVDCRLLLNNRVGQHRVRLNMPLPFPTDEVDVERAFVVAHENLARFKSDPGQNTHPMRHWVAASDGAGGLAFVGGGLHEYAIENAEGSPPGEQTTSDLRVTLLRSVPFVDTCGSWRTPDAELRRELEYGFALLPFTGDWRAGRVAERAARCLQRSAAEVFGEHAPDWETQPHASIKLEEQREVGWTQVSSHRSTWRRHFGERDGWRTHERLADTIHAVPSVPIQLDGEHVLLSCVKPAERAPDGGDDTSRDIIVRFYSLHDREQVAAIRFGFPVAGVWASDLAETPLKGLEESQGRVPIQVGKFEIVTLRVRPAPSRQTAR